MKLRAMSKINMMVDTPETAMIKMADGNPGALEFFTQLVRYNQTNSHNIWRDVVMPLDNMGIYGTDVYVLWNDLCDRDTAMAVAVVRAVDMDLLGAATLKDACSKQDRSGREMLDVEDLFKQVTATN